MKHKKTNKNILSALYLVLVPIFLGLFSLIFAKTENFDYNKTIIYNISENLGNENKRALFKFETKNDAQLKDWDNYATIFNRDFYGYNVLFRTSKESFKLNFEKTTPFNALYQFDVIFSDIQKCDIVNNQTHNFSSLKIERSMEEFGENSIILNQDLANLIGVESGDTLTLNYKDNEIEFSVFDVYSNTANQSRFINNAYLEFDKQLCFISREVFNSISSDSFDGYVSIGQSDILTYSTYVELSPLFSINNSYLVVSGNFSMNDFEIRNQSLKDYQNMIFDVYNSHSSVGHYIFIGFLLSFFIENLILTFDTTSILIRNSKKVYEHSVLLAFLYTLFVFGVSFASVSLLTKFFSTATNNSYILYYSLKLPLIGLTIFVLLQIVLLSIAILASNRRQKEVAIKQRKNEIRELKLQSDKIIFVTGSLSRGGAEKVIVELANHYASLGRKVDIVILLNNIVAWDIHKDVNVIDLSGNTNSRVKRIKYWLTRLKSYFSQNVGSTIVSFLVRVNILVLLTAKKREHKIIISERNDPRYDGRGLIVSSFTKFLYPKADRIIFQTKECKELFSNDIQEKGTVISNPITINKFADLTAFNEKLFISAGRIAKQKNQITMIKAMRTVVKADPDVKLEIYGDGDLTKTLKQKIEKWGLNQNAFVLPNIKDINDRIINSRAYICTSLYEGMSNSLMEASFAGIPCITTRCFGTDFIIEGKNGYSIDFESPKDLAKKMLTILDNNKYKALRKHSIEMAKQTEHDNIYVQWEACINNE